VTTGWQRTSRPMRPGRPGPWTESTQGAGSDSTHTPTSRLRALVIFPRLGACRGEAGARLCQARPAGATGLDATRMRPSCASEVQNVALPRLSATSARTTVICDLQRFSWGRSISPSAPGRIRTCDPRLRRPPLYPAELPGRVPAQSLGPPPVLDEVSARRRRRSRSPRGRRTRSRRRSRRGSR
jgi:hypothetical protein